MRTYQTKLNDGRIFYVVAFSKPEVPSLLEEKGVGRESIERIRRMDKGEYAKARKQRVLVCE